MKTGLLKSHVREKPITAESVRDSLEEPIEVRLDETGRGGEDKFVVFVTLDRLGETAVRRQFLTEGAPSQLFDMAEYLTERIARHLNVTIGDSARGRFGVGMTENR